MFLLCLAYLFYSQSLSSTSLKAIDGDGNDYYSYLVSIFIDHNLGHQDLTPWYVINTPTGTINVHTVGLAILWLPFFLLGYIFANLFNYPVDGFSPPFQIMMQTAAFVYGFFGLHFFQKVIGLITSNFKIRIITTLCILFGTNLLFYFVNSPTMSHLYSFTFISVFVYLTRQVFVAQRYDRLYLLSIVLALIILIRPFNAVVLLLLPMWSASLPEFFTRLKSILSHKKQVLISIVLFISLLSIQSFVWLVQNGKFLQDSYKGNGFYFTSPETYKFLFGFTSGFFIYTPLCLIVLFFGFAKLIRVNMLMFFITLLFLGMIIYVLSSYWGYTFSDSLGMRVMVDYYVIFGILLVYALNFFASKVLKYTLYSGIAVSVLFSLLFHYQYLNSILSPAYMTYEKFKYVFLKTGKTYQNAFGGCNDLEPYLKTKPTIPVFSCSSNPIEYSSQREYGIECKFDPVKLKTNKLYLEIEIERTEKEANSSSKAIFACSIKDSLKKDKFWYAFKINETPSYGTNNNRKYYYSLAIDKKIESSDAFVVFIWNIEHQNFTVNKFNVKVYDYNFET